MTKKKQPKEPAVPKDKRERGRPEGTEISIDIEQIEKLASIGATQVEMANFLGVAHGTLEERLQRPRFRAAYERGMASLRLSLRRQQVKLADAGNPTMLIWLGKQLLGQRDITALQHSGPNEGPIKHDTSGKSLTDRILEGLSAADDAEAAEVRP